MFLRLQLCAELPGTEWHVRNFMQVGLWVHRGSLQLCGIFLSPTSERLNTVAVLNSISKTVQHLDCKVQRWTRADGEVGGTLSVGWGDYEKPQVEPLWWTCKKMQVLTDSKTDVSPCGSVFHWCKLFMPDMPQTKSWRWHSWCKWKYNTPVSPFIFTKAWNELKINK